MQHPDNLVWIDLEMTGLDSQRDHILEIATLITAPSSTSSPKVRSSPSTRTPNSSTTLTTGTVSITAKAACWSAAA